MVDALTLATVFNAGHGTASEKLVDPGFPLATGKEQGEAMKIMIIAALVLLLAGLCVLAQKAGLPKATEKFVKGKMEKFPVTEWEHGLETSNVRATRIKNNIFGHSIKIEYPKNPNECDRAELDDFINSKNGWIYQGGGYPGAPAYVKFKDVTDRESANKKLREILPELSQLMMDISAGKKITPIINPNAKQWPDTDPPDKTDQFWEFNNNLSLNGTQYKKVEVSPGKWQWAEDEIVMKSMLDAEDHKQKLFLALTTRILTDKELIEVQSYGHSLNVAPNVSYYAEEKQQELTRAFLVQQMLRNSKEQKAHQ